MHPSFSRGWRATGCRKRKTEVLKGSPERTGSNLIRPGCEGTREATEPLRTQSRRNRWMEHGRPEVQRRESCVVQREKHASLAEESAALIHLQKKRKHKKSHTCTHMSHKQKPKKKQTEYIQMICFCSPHENSLFFFFCCRLLFFWEESLGNRKNEREEKWWAGAAPMKYSSRTRLVPVHHRRPSSAEDTDISLENAPASFSEKRQNANQNGTL